MMLCGLLTMLQASVCDGLSFDPFPFDEDGLAANPKVDAGIIAMSHGGAAYAADTPHVQRRGDAGRALLRSPNGEAVVAVLHNAIRPFRPLASLAAEFALDSMVPNDRPDGWITFTSGVPLVSGAANAVDVAGDGKVTAIFLEDRKYLVGLWSLGIGYETPVIEERQVIATMLYEPYMVVEDGRLRRIDGQTQLAVPIRKT